MATRRQYKKTATKELANYVPENSPSNGNGTQDKQGSDIEYIPGVQAAIYGNEEIRKKNSQGHLIKFLPWCPKVVKHFYIPDSSQESTHIYHIEVNDEVQEGTNHSVAKGLIWDKFSNLSGANGRYNIDILANVVKHQAKKIPLTAGYTTVGWAVVKDYETVTERYAYILEDGRGLDGTEYYVERTTKDVVNRGKKHMPVLPLPEQDRDTSESVLAWAYRASPKGHQILSLAKQFRSYLDNIVPSLNSFFLYGAESDIRKNSNLGKTTVELASHNLSFRKRYSDPPHASFQGTDNSVEKIIARQQSSNCLIDDLNIPLTASEKDVRDIVKIFIGIVRTNANNDVAKTRLNRDLSLAKGSEYHFLPGITGELLPNVLASIERRMVSLPVYVGDIDLPTYEAEWEQVYADRLLRLGHMALREIERRRNVDDDLLRHEIEQHEKEATAKLLSDVRAYLGRDISQLCQYLPSKYARLLTGIWALGKYAYNEEAGIEWARKMYPYVFDFLLLQINRMDGYRQPEDKGSVTSLIHMIRDEIASGKRISGQKYRIVDRKTGHAPDITLPNGEKIDSALFGWNENDSDTKEYVTLAFTDNNGSEPVLYPHPIFYTTLVERANRLDEFKSLRSVDAIKDALKAEGWLARVNERAKQNDIDVRLPGVAGRKHRELKLSLYISEETSGTLVTSGTNAIDGPVRPFYAVPDASKIVTDGQGIRDKKEEHQGQGESACEVGSDPFVPDVPDVPDKISSAIQPSCPTCGKTEEVTYIEQVGCWHCYRCQEVFKP